LFDRHCLTYHLCGVGPPTVSWAWPTQTKGRWAVWQ